MVGWIFYLWRLKACGHQGTERLLATKEDNLEPATGLAQSAWTGITSSGLLPFSFPQQPDFSCNEQNPENYNSPTESESHSVRSNSLWPHRLYSPWHSPGQNTGVGSLSLLQIFPSQGSNPGFLHCRQILYQLSHKERPRILRWVAYPFSSWSSGPRNWTRVSCIADGFFTSWAIREALQLTYRGPLKRGGKKKQKQINPPPVRFLIWHTFWTFQYRNYKKHLRKFKHNSKKLCGTSITESSSLEVHHVNRQRRYWLPN